MPKRKTTLTPNGRVVSYLVNVVLGWDRDRFAKELRVTDRTVDDIMTGDGKYSMSMANFNRLVAVLNVALAECRPLRPPVRREELLTTFHGRYTDGLGLNETVVAARPSASIDDVYLNQALANGKLQDWASTNKTVRATIIDYSSHTIKPFVQCLLQLGVAVELYLQAADAAESLGSVHQAQLIAGESSQFRTESTLKTAIAENKLHLRFYNTPPSFLGVRFDDELLCLGFHVWLPVFSGIKDFDKGVSVGEDALERRDRVLFNSHDLPHLIVSKAHAGLRYHRLSSMFNLAVTTYSNYYEANYDRPEFLAMRKALQIGEFANSVGESGSAKAVMTQPRSSHRKRR